MPRFLELCVSALHRGHANTLQIIDLVSQNCTCHPCRGHALYFKKKKLCMYVSSLQKRAMQNLSLRNSKKNVQLIPCGRENRLSCAGAPMISSAFRGRLFREIRTFGRAVEVPAFRPSQTLWAASQAVDERMTHQESVPLLHSSSLRFVPELWPWIWAVAPAVLPSSSGKHAPSKAPAPHGARAQPYVDCIVPLGAPDALLPSHLSWEPRRFSLEGASWGGAVLPHQRLQLQRCFQRSLEGESDRVQAEHDERPAFLALDFLARLRSTVPNVRYQLHWCALHHVALPVRLQRRYVFCSQLLRRGQTAQERHPHMHVRGDRAVLERLRALLRACS